MTIVMNEVTMNRVLTKKEKPASRVGGVERTIAAGEFKAKCLRIMDEVNETGRPVIVTKRGQPSIRVVPIADGKKRDSIFGRLAGIMKIHGDPDDLIKPIVPLEDWDMLK
jgi:prevent-host-death family protein